MHGATMDNKSKILVAGATGFIGRSLVARLHADGHTVRCLSRRPRPMPDGVEMMIGDLQDLSSLQRALEGIDTAYYLVHSLDSGENSYAKRDQQSAENFITMADQHRLRRVIYLSGLGNPQTNLSGHLRSRQQVAEILKDGRAQATILRAAIIIGAGSASFEILQFLVKTQLLLPEPEGLESRCQPIALTNVIGYLVGCLTEERTADQTFEIGGPEVLTYRQMLEVFAEIAGTVNLFFPVPFYTPKIAAALIGSLSTINSDVALALLEGLKDDVICTENRIRDLIPQVLIPYAEAVRNALAEKRER
jgi:uncharacterized protein YbjT (DUF2867 family)